MVSIFSSLQKEVSSFRNFSVSRYFFENYQKSVYFSRDYCPPNDFFKIFGSEEKIRYTASIKSFRDSEALLKVLNF